MKLCGKEMEIRGRMVRIGRVAAEGFEFLEDPETAVESLRRSRGMDLLTFLQPLPHDAGKHSYPSEQDNLAVLRISTFQHWWNKQIDGKTRNMVRRAEKKGIVLREVAFDAELAKGIWEIYNECPVRQGRPFPHFGKDLETVHRMSATFLETSVFVGAYFEEKLVGFLKLTFDDARTQAAVMHIISMVQHRDKAPMNALIAEGVKACEKYGIPCMVYSKFSYGKRQRDSLSDFKESNGFQRVNIPRYYVPVTWVGSMALRLGLHHGLIEHLPEPVMEKLREYRNYWNSRKH